MNGQQVHEGTLTVTGREQTEIRAAVRPPLTPVSRAVSQEDKT